MGGAVPPPDGSGVALFNASGPNVDSPDLYRGGVEPGTVGNGANSSDLPLMAQGGAGPVAAGPDYLGANSGPFTQGSDFSKAGVGENATPITGVNDTATPAVGGFENNATPVSAGYNETTPATGGDFLYSPVVNAGDVCTTSNPTGDTTNSSTYAAGDLNQTFGTTAVSGAGAGGNIRRIVWWRCYNPDQRAGDIRSRWHWWHRDTG